jgi:hypothetical protein
MVLKNLCFDLVFCLSIWLGGSWVNWNVAWPVGLRICSKYVQCRLYNGFVYIGTIVAVHWHCFLHMLCKPTPSISNGLFLYVMVPRHILS